jgi:tetratricopeptide (TPR) repeat protein
MHPVSWRGPFEQSIDRERLRSRVLAFTGIWFLLAGFLATLGFGAVLLASLALLLVGGVAAGGLWLLRRYQVRRGLRKAVLSIERASRSLQARLAELRPQQRLQRFGQIASHSAQKLLTGARRSSSTAVGRVRAHASEIRQREQAAVGLQRQALRLNELGAQFRREGNHEQAAEQHRAALAIVRQLGDRHAEALTLNNLALALVHTGSVSVAVQHFEQALVLFRELGDEEHEGQVIANVGFVRRRQGRDEDAESLLHAALDKLPPDSSAYHMVEAELRRAS